MDATHYTYRVQWSAEDDSYVATVAELPSLSWAAGEPGEALQGILSLVADVLADMAETGEEAPLPIADRAYSGKFIVRVPPELHRQLVLEAAEQHISLNQLATSRLADGPDY